MALRIWDVNPDAYVILEHLAENTEEKNLAEFGMMLWGNMNYEYSEATMGYSSNVSGISYKNRTWSVPHLVGYMESHDEERLMYKNLQYGNSVDGYNIKDLHTGLRMVELAANFFIPVPGPKMIWQFGELGYDYSINYDCRVCNKPIRWDYFTSNREKLYYVFKALNELKTNYDVFNTSDFSLIQSENTKVLQLFGNEMDVVILGNFDVEAKDINPYFPGAGEWYEYYSGDTLNVSDTEELITLDPGEYRMFTTLALNKPDIPLNIGDNSAFTENSINVYPNPSSDIFYFDVRKIKSQQGELHLYDIKGQQVFSRSIDGQDIVRYNSSEIPSGIYFFRIVTDQSIYTGKILKR